MTTFTLECFQNEFLAEGSADVDAILTMSVAGIPPARVEQDSSYVLMIDVSGSMDGEKIRQARKATIAAIDCVRDGERFAVVAGKETAYSVYPTSGLAVSSPETRQLAHTAVERLRAGGGTRIGRWIRKSTELLSGQTGVRQAILLTDGKNENESPEELADAVRRAAGAFQCDCRGVGTDWDVPEVRGIAEALLGTVGLIKDPAHLVEDFEEIMRGASSKALADVALRVWVPEGAEVTFVKQVAPDILDLTGFATSAGPRALDFPTGAWGDESRDYHVSLRVRPAQVGDQMLAARVTVVVGGEAAGQALVRATWTDDAALSTRINGRVAHFTGQEGLADAIQDGVEAHRRGDDDTAAVKFARAIALAEAAGNAEAGERLARVVEVDASTGRVRMKQNVDEADAMDLDARSTRTVRVRK